MAIVHCPNCSKRISSIVTVCPHCDAALGELTPEEQERIKRRRWKRLIYRAKNLSYLALTLLVVGALWWWFAGTQGWVLPPPLPAIAMVMTGAVLYLVARCWMLWLRLGRNRPDR